MRPGWEDRILARVVAAGNDCWEWAGAHNPDGYGTAYPASKPRGAHRVVYELLVGPIPEGLTIDHLCRNRGCVNPDHMETVPKSVNILRGVGPGALNAAKTHCPQGHPYDTENTYVKPDGQRVCRTCKREQSNLAGRRRRARDRALAEEFEAACRGVSP